MSYTCHACEVQLASFAAGELAAADRARVKDHLAICAACCAELERENDLRLLLGGLPTATCPERVTAGLSATTTTAGQPLLLTRRWLPAAGLAAAVLLAVVFVPGSAWRQFRSGEPTPVADRTYTAAEVARARREAIATLALAANVLERSRERTVSEVFGLRLPRAVAGSLVPHDSQSENSNSTPNASSPGGNG